MNKIWGYIIIISVIVGLFSGKVQLLTTCVFDSAKSTIDTCLNIFGIIAIWSGLMKIAEQTGLIEKMQSLVYPLVRVLFPEIPKNSSATSNIAMNMGANIIGLGNVATPLGIKAMEELQKENKNKKRQANDNRARMLITALTREAVHLGFKPHLKKLKLILVRDPVRTDEGQMDEIYIPFVLVSFILTPAEFGIVG